ncbi:MAG: ribosome-associated translation inhibitor RaiA [Candidatus Scalindua sediminis]
MEIIIHGRHLDITEAIKNYVKKKASKLTKYSNRINKIQVTLKIEGQSHILEAICSIAGATLVAEAANSDMYAAIDIGMDKLEKQLIRQREKLKHHKGNKKVGEIGEIGEVAE